MGNPGARWECPQCGYLLPDSAGQCGQCRYVRTKSDAGSVRGPDDTNSWVLHRLEVPLLGGRVRPGTWAAAAAVTGIGVAALVILLLSML